MSVDRREAARVAELARLALDDGELDALAEDLGRILDHVRVLGSVPPAEGEAADEPWLGPPPDEGGSARGTGRVRAPAEDSGGERLRAPPPDAQTVEAGGPDPLVHPLETIAPDFRDGFFAVPPPPGVVAGDDA